MPTASALPTPWKVSLHGGHSVEFCDHARSPLDAILDQAQAEGMAIFGVTEHAPRVEARFLYDEEVAMGWTIETLHEKFEAYAVEVRRQAALREGELLVLCAMECEVVPNDTWLGLMQGWRQELAWDYVVGSVHHVFEVQIDGPRRLYDEAVDQAGGLFELGAAYYHAVADMVERLRPEVVGHLDLITKNAQDAPWAESAQVRQAAFRALDVIAASGAVLDVNTAGWRKGLPHPYPAPWLVRAALERNIGFCLGDDSHATDDVAHRFQDAARWLRQLGVRHLTIPAMGPRHPERRLVALPD
jgi:histidinol-phosphatase (PHP family)